MRRRAARTIAFIGCLSGFGSMLTNEALAELWPNAAASAATLLSSDDAASQLKGADRLFTLSERSAYPLTLVALRSQAPEVREVAARRALLFERTLPNVELFPLLEGGSEEERLLGLALVRGELSGELFEKVVHLARGKNENISILALEKLERAGPEVLEQALDTAILRLSDPSPDLRAASFRCLGALPSLRARTALGFGEDSDEKVRLARYGALFEQGALGGELGRALTDPSPRVRARVARFALHLDDPAALAAVGALLGREKDRTTFEAVVTALVEQGTEDSFGILVEFLRKGRPSGRLNNESQAFASFAEEKVATALNKGGPRAAAHLRACLEDRTPGVAIRCTKPFLGASSVVEVRPLLELERRGVVAHKTVLSWLTEATEVDERGLVEAAQALNDGDAELRTLGLRILENADPLPSSFLEPIREFIHARGRDPIERARALALLAGQGALAREEARPFRASTSEALARAAKLIELEFCDPEVLSEWLRDGDFAAWATDQLERGMSVALAENLVRGALGGGANLQARVFAMLAKGPPVGRESAASLASRLGGFARSTQTDALRLIVRSEGDERALLDLEPALRVAWVQLESRPLVLLARTADPDARVRVLSLQRLAQLSLTPTERSEASAILRKVVREPHLTKWERIALFGAARSLGGADEFETTQVSPGTDAFLRAARLRLLTKGEDFERELRRGGVRDPLLRGALYAAAKRSPEGSRVVAGCLTREADAELASFCAKGASAQLSHAGDAMTLAALDFRGEPLGSRPLLYRDVEGELGVVFTDADGFFDLSRAPREIFDPVLAY